MTPNGLQVCRRVCYIWVMEANEVMKFTASYLAQAGGVRAGMCWTLAWNVRDQFGWPLVEGSYNGTPHAWNIAPDGSIFDGTAGQFSDGHGPRFVDSDDPRYIPKIGATS